MVAVSDQKTFGTIDDSFRKLKQKDGKMEGPSESYHENGECRSKNKYKNGIVVLQAVC